MQDESGGDRGHVVSEAGDEGVQRGQVVVTDAVAKPWRLDQGYDALIRRSISRTTARPPHSALDSIATSRSSAG